MSGDNRFSDDDELWEEMYYMSAEEAATHPAPYTWMAVLLYAADFGWAINPTLTLDQYETGENLWGYDARIRTYPMEVLPEPPGAQLPGAVDAPGGNG